MEYSIYVIQGLIALLIAVIGYMLNKSLTRLDTLEFKCGDLMKTRDFNRFKDNEFKGQARNIESLRERQENKTSELYKHLDSKTDRIRDEITQMSTSFNERMDKTNNLLTQLVNSK